MKEPNISDVSERILGVRQRLEDWLSEYLRSSQLDGLLVGVSGGIDSALCAKLGSAVAAKTGKTMTALSLPITYDGRIDGRDMTGFYESHRIPSRTYDLTTLYECFMEIMPVSDLVIRSNIRTRLRAAALYTYANQHKLLLVGTLNRIECAIGYFQKHAAIGDVLPLARLSKETIRALAKSYEVPAELVQRRASGCVHGQNAEDEWGVSEDLLDRMISADWRSIRLDGVPESIIRDVRRRIETSGHKRRFPPVFNYEV
jgi:NAD+ synthase